MPFAKIIFELEHRRRQLGMSCAVVAARSNLGLRTVQRALSSEESPEFETLEKIAAALGASLQLGITGHDVESMKQAQAEAKAERLVALTQGTSALEAQAVSLETRHHLVNQAVRQLLRGSTRKLWADS
jgi:transcriptional regulator with XRE-family HTH domain